jgi:histone acetyltransferase (RNA polymerase elongator complex component)
MEACPFQCIYCDQEKISGHAKIPDEKYVLKIIKKHLETIPADAEIQVGFFGGTFTGLKPEIQQMYLEVVQPFIRNGSIKSIRLSTRPDFISSENLELLKKYYVETIELGAQSMDDGVLKKSGRGHKAQKTIEASGLIREKDFRLGLQMMIGLPGDTSEKSINTAKKFVELGAQDVRIYPTLVIKGTPLEKLYHSGKFSPLTLEDAVNLTAAIIPVFENAGVNVIRVGLHPSEGLMDKSDLIAGPFHVSFKELVLTKLWHEQLCNIARDRHNDLTVFIPPGELNYAVGYEAGNKKMLLEKFRRVRFKIDSQLTNRNYHVDYC